LRRFQLKRQLPQPLSRRRKNRIRDRRRSRRQPRLTHPPVIFLAANHVHLDRRSFADPDRIIPIKVRLLDRTILDRDLILQRGAQPVDDRAFRLRAHRLRIHNLPAIHRRDNAVNLELAALHRHLGHFGSGLPQPAFSAANSSTPSSRAGSGSSSLFAFQFVGLTSRDLRNCTGSCPAAAANSSMKLSTANPLNEFSTDRHQARGTALATGLNSSRTFGIAYGISFAPPTSWLSGAAFGSQYPRIDVDASV